MRLEEIEVLAAWGLRASRAATTYPIQFNLLDDFLPQIAAHIGELSATIPIRIVGARQDRASVPAVFWPRAYERLTPPSDTVTYISWDIPAVGLSWALRQEPQRAARVVQDLVNSVNRLAR